MATSLSPLNEQILSMLQKIDQDLVSLKCRGDSFDRRLTAIEGRLKLDESQITPGFPQFARLPKEIQLMIWESAIPRRKLRHYNCTDRYTVSTGRALPTRGLPPPTISQVCKASRRMAKLNGAGMFRLCRGEGNETYWTWFDGTHDVLELGTPCCIGCDVSDGGCMNILSHAQTILVHLGDIQHRWVYKLFGHIKICQTLKTINVQITRSEPVTKEAWHPQVVAELFQQNTVVMIDIHSAKDLSRLKQIVERNSTRCSDYDFDNCIALWQQQENRLRRSDTNKKAKRYNLEWTERVFKEAWRCRRESSEVKYDLETRSGRDKRKEDSIPRIRFVYTIELSENGEMLGSEDSLGPTWYEFLDEHPAYVRQPYDTDSSEDEEEAE